jgi:catechol 2,3-dioxygenase
MTTETHFNLDAAPIAVSYVDLNVIDLDRMTHFYRDVLGFQIFEATSETVTLGANRPFLTLHARPHAAPQDRRAAGPFHVAFLLPERSDLKDWCNHAAAFGVYPYGASDHNVSEALYLDDPEGNGIELYVDRPLERWIDTHGLLFMPSQRLDLNALPSDGPWHGAPRGTRIGHIHLQTVDIAFAEAFWTELGFDVTARYPGGSFFGAGGYHHQIAVNVWASADAPPRTPDAAGLSSLALETTDDRIQTLTAPSGVTVKLAPKGT